MSWLSKQFHNVTSGIKHTIEDIPGSVKGFVNNPLQSIEKGVGGVINAASLGMLHDKLGMKFTEIGGTGLAAAAIAGTGQYLITNMNTGLTTTTNILPTTAADQAAAQAALSGSAVDLTAGSAAGGPAASSFLSGLGKAGAATKSFLKDNAGTLAAAGIPAIAGVYSAGKMQDAADAASARQSDIMNRSLDLQEQQIQNARDLGQQQIDLANQEYQRRVDTGNKLEANATLTPDYIDSQVSRAGLTTSKGYSNALDAEQRNLARMGVDASSGRFAGVNRATRLAQAGATSDAMNNTRLGLTNYARGLRSQALSAELGISNPAIEATGQQSGRAIQSAGLAGNTGIAYGNIYGNQAQQYNTNAANALNYGLSASGTILGNELDRRRRNSELYHLSHNSG